MVDELESHRVVSLCNVERVKSEGTGEVGGGLLWGEWSVWQQQ